MAGTATWWASALCPLPSGRVESQFLCSCSRLVQLSPGTCSERPEIGILHAHGLIGPPSHPWSLAKCVTAVGGLVLALASNTLPHSSSRAAAGPANPSWIPFPEAAGGVLPTGPAGLRVRGCLSQPCPGTTQIHTRVKYEDPQATDGLAGALDARQQSTGAIPVTQACLMEDIEQWLSTDVGNDVEEPKGVTSEEFDKFLEERAKVADRLPSLSSPTAEGPPGPRPGSTPRKKTQEKDDDMLFAL